MNNKTVVAFGEIMLRLTPSASILNASEYKAIYGGTESNVLVSLSTFGNKTRYLTKLPDNDLGRGAIMHLKRYGVGCDSIISAGDNMGIYFLEKGYGSRNAKVIYSRKHSEVTSLTKSDFDFDEIFHNAALFHISGISFALSDSVKELCFCLLEEAKKRNIPISFDFNYRAKLWDTDTAAAVYKKIIPFVDYVFCSIRDLDVFLNVNLDEYFTIYNNTKYLIVREREIAAQDKHIIKAKVYTKDKVVASAAKTAEILERIGGGDAFAAGFIHGILNYGGNIQKTLDFAADCFVMKATLEGDVLYTSEKEINALNIASSKDVTR